jgi:hypothetical protein
MIALGVILVAAFSILMGLLSKEIEMKTYVLIVQYDGTDYAGFQVQPGQRTIQGELRKALSRLGPNFIRIAGAAELMPECTVKARR